MQTISQAKSINLPLSSIITLPQIRSSMEKTALRELADDMLTNGVLQPILVRPAGRGKYRVIAGHRRHAAAQLAELKNIPAMVRDADDAQALMMQLSENIHREDLSDMDVANALRQIFDELGTLDAVAAFVQKSRAWVSKRLSLTMPDFSFAAKRAFEDGITEDLEIIGVINQVHQLCYNDADALTHFLQLVKDGYTREQCRAYLKELKAQIAEKQELDEAKAKVAALNAKNRKPPKWTADDALTQIWFALRHDDEASPVEHLKNLLPEQVKELARVVSSLIAAGIAVHMDNKIENHWRAAARVTRQRPRHFEVDAYLWGLLRGRQTTLIHFLETVHESMHDREHIEPKS
jgi:ParB/RepB/Spo0J family partition protein